jgi:hypothetical protein
LFFALKSLIAPASADWAPLSASDLSQPSAVPMNLLQPPALAGAAAATQSPAIANARAETHKTDFM